MTFVAHALLEHVRLEINVFEHAADGALAAETVDLGHEVPVDLPPQKRDGVGLSSRNPIIDPVLVLKSRDDKSRRRCAVVIITQLIERLVDLGGKARLISDG